MTDLTMEENLTAIQETLIQDGHFEPIPGTDRFKITDKGKAFMLAFFEKHPEAYPLVFPNLVNKP